MKTITNEDFLEMYCYPHTKAEASKALEDMIASKPKPSWKTKEEIYDRIKFVEGSILDNRQIALRAMDEYAAQAIAEKQTEIDRLKSIIKAFENDLD